MQWKLDERFTIQPCLKLFIEATDAQALKAEVLRVAAQVVIEKVRNRYITTQFQAHSSRRFQFGFDRFNLHRTTLVLNSCELILLVFWFAILM